MNADGLVFQAFLGRSGCTAFKAEGDGATPLARMRIAYGFYRADRVSLPQTRLPMIPVRADMGWCDAPDHPSYNRPVRLPFGASHEVLMRNDRLYDICLVLDWNISERRRHRGSAIFMHLTHPEGKPTEGCIAVSPSAMRRLLPLLRKGTVVQVL
ncbi:L,D-transpeptidase [Hoeflea sp. TYP-13]|uniref:L,D-transpeptidase n=1 Tax=Hoeflea sp. TYP-13 TaxID=3230023 RepID=UPI0034C5FC0E